MFKILFIIVMSKAWPSNTIGKVGDFFVLSHVIFIFF